MPQIRWKDLADEAEVRTVLLRELPLGTPAATVRAFLTDQGLEFERDDEHAIYIRTAKRGPRLILRHPIKWLMARLFVKAEWMMKLTLRDGQLTAVSVELFLTGP